MYDAIRMAKAAGFKIRMQVQGVCGVQAVYLLQAADERIITPNSFIVMAEAQFPNIRINSAEVAGMVDFRKNLDAQGQKILLSRSKVTADQLKDKTDHTRTWQVNAAEALELGIVDTVGVHLQPGRQLPALNFKPYADDDTADVRLAKAKLRVALLRERLFALETREAGSFDSGNKTEIIYLFDQVDIQSVYNLTAFAQKFERQEGVNFELVLNTPGGSVHDGLAAMDVLDAVRAKGHKLTIRVLGQAASMGGFLLQSADERLIGENARVLIHRMSTIFGGSGSQMEEQKEQMERLQAQALPKLVSRSTIGVDEVQKRSENKDWWLTGKEAVELGFADKTF
jgi:ATP-dependent protease ClpP protease subunit